MFALGKRFPEKRSFRQVARAASGVRRESHDKVVRDGFKGCRLLVLGEVSNQVVTNEPGSNLGF